MVAHRVLHVWSRLHCKWIAWKGTYAAWKLLPHAVVVGCTVTWVTIHLHTPPVNVPNTPEVPPYVYLVGIPSSGQQSGPPDWVWLEYPGVYLGAPERHCHWHCKHEKHVVPEPGSWALMLAGLAMLGWKVKL